MGARSSHTLKEIEGIRASLDGKLVELERRLPPLVRHGRKAAVALAGGGAGATALLLVAKRVRKSRKRESLPAAPSAPVVVNVFPKAAGPVALAAVAVWAGVRVFEVLQRPGREQAQPAAVLTPVPGRSATS